MTQPLGEQVNLLPRDSDDPIDLWWFIADDIVAGRTVQLRIETQATVYTFSSNEKTGPPDDEETICFELETAELVVFDRHIGPYDVYEQFDVPRFISRFTHLNINETVTKLHIAILPD